MKKKHSKTKSTRQEKQQVTALTNFLRFCTEKQLAVVFENFFDATKFDPSQTSFAYHFDGQPLNAPALLRLIRNAKEQNKSKLVVLCENMGSDCVEIRRHSPIEVTTVLSKEVFLTLKEQNALPPLETKKFKICPFKSQFFQVMFNSSRSKFYLSSAIFLFLFSLVIPFSTYYLVMGSVLILMFFVSFFAKYLKIEES